MAATTAVVATGIETSTKAAVATVKTKAVAARKWAVLSYEQLMAQPYIELDLIHHLSRQIAEDIDREILAGLMAESRRPPRWQFWKRWRRVA